MTLHTLESKTPDIPTVKLSAPPLAVLSQSNMAAAGRELGDFASRPDAAVAKVQEDLTGRDRVLRSFVSGWLPQFLQIASGFVLPRLISDQLGQGSLGIWDFGWTVVSYFALLQGGIVSSVNRYVARHRATGDFAGVNQSVNSVRLVLNAIAILTAILTVLAAWLLPRMMHQQLGGLTSEASGVLLLLGFTSAVQIQGAVFGGILTGCHRWTVHNAIKAGTAIVSVGGGLLVIGCGGNIVMLSGVMLASEILMRAAQRVAALRVCPELTLSRKSFDWPKAKEMMHFGGKSYLTVISQMFSNQTTSLIVASTFGVGALALFSRPRNLIRSVASVVQLNAMVMVPMVSAIEAGGRIEELRQLAISGTRYAVFFCLPVLIFLLVMGRDVMQLWMGVSYVNQAILGVFAVSGLVEAMSFPLHRVLMGMNRHGRIATLNLIAAGMGASIAGLCVLHPARNLLWVAISLALPSLLVNGLLLPLASARILQLPLRQLIGETWRLPVLCCLPGTVCLLTVALALDASPLLRILSAAAAAAAGSAFLFWKHALPGPLKAGTARRLRFASHQVSA
ncbi:MAG: hypothetical protein EON58_01185 [Alphaproteobacteria bacterium]|nr:MAG: hypothetical protein EON58_01185 [Alphaproteobacteria bacterium]